MFSWGIKTLCNKKKQKIDVLCLIKDYYPYLNRRRDFGESYFIQKL